jgi:cell division protease FtsH
VQGKKGIITNANILDAIDKSLIGIIKQNDTRDMSTIMRVAIHETGHAIMASLYPEYFDLKKVSIQSSYSGVGGYTIFNEHANITEGGLYTRDILYKRLMIAMGGKAAESIYYGDDFISLGANQDLKTANELAQRMVGNYGMGEDLKVFYKDDGSTYSPETIRKYDEEIQELVQKAYAEAKYSLSRRVGEMNFLINRLVTEKTVYEIDPYTHES